MVIKRPNGMFGTGIELEFSALVAVTEKLLEQITQKRLVVGAALRTRGLVADIEVRCHTKTSVRIR